MSVGTIALNTSKARLLLASSADHSSGGVAPPWPYTFNLCVSNVPGPPEPLYFNGSRLEATYPVSIPIHGMALNITLQSYADTMNLGFVGCRGYRGFFIGSLARGPPFSGLRIGEFSEKRDLSVGEIWPPKSRFFIVRNKTLSGNGVQIVIVFFTQNWPQIHRNFDFF